MGSTGSGRHERRIALFHPDLGENLARNRVYFEKHFASLKNLQDYTQRLPEGAPRPIKNLGNHLDEMASRLTRLKSALFDIGIEIKPTSKNLAQDFLKSATKLYPFYLCGKKEKGVRLFVKIYTKKGDQGMTYLFGGGPYPKDDPVIEAYGSVDELNSTLGCALTELAGPRISTNPS